MVLASLSVHVGDNNNLSYTTIATQANQYVHTQQCRLNTATGMFLAYCSILQNPGVDRAV